MIRNMLSVFLSGIFLIAIAGFTIVQHHCYLGNATYFSFSLENATCKNNAEHCCFEIVSECAHRGISDGENSCSCMDGHNIGYIGFTTLTQSGCENQVTTFKTEKLYSSTRTPVNFEAPEEPLPLNHKIINSSHNSEVVNYTEYNPTFKIPSSELIYTISQLLL